MAGFSKLIWADSLLAAQTLASVVGKFTTANYSSIADTKDFSALTATDTLYTAEAQKALLFTADGYIVTHGYQYYTGIPIKDKSAVGLIKPFNINELEVSTVTAFTDADDRKKALLIKSAFDTKDTSNTNYLYTAYAVQTDKYGLPYVVTENAALYSHKLYVTGDFSGTSDAYKPLFDPTADTTWSFAKATNTAATGDPDNHYNKFTISDTSKTATVSIDPAIAGNIVADTTGAHTANRLIVFTSGSNTTNDVLGGADSSISVSDSGFGISRAGETSTGYLSTTTAFTKDSSTHAYPYEYYSDYLIPTELAVAKYVNGALGEISGAMRYRGTSETTYKASTEASATAIWAATGTWTETPGTVNTTTGVVTAPETIVSKVCKTSYQDGDVYYVNTPGWYAGQYCEKGDMLVALVDGDGTKADLSSDWTVVQNNWTALDGVSAVDWGKTYTLATIGGVNIDIKMPASPVSESTFVFDAGTKTTGSIVSSKYTVSPEDLSGSETNGESYLNYYGYTRTYDSAEGEYVLTPSNYNVKVLGAIKETDASSKTTYTASGAIISVESVRTSANEQILNIVHGNDLGAHYSTGGKAIKAVAYDRWGHITESTDISNLITLHSNDTTTVDNKGTESYAGLKATDWYITGATSLGGVTSMGAGTGHVNGDISLATKFVTVGEGTAAHKELQVYVNSFQLRFRKISIKNSAVEDVAAQTNLNDLVFEAGANVKLTASTDSDNKTSTIKIDARDTWRSIKYYWKNDTTALSPAGTGFNDSDDITASDTTGATANFEMKTLGTNALVFGQEFAMRKSDETESAAATEVHIEWCEISAAGAVTYTY